MRPRILPGSPSRRSLEWVDPATGETTSAESVGEAARSTQGAIERTRIPDAYRDQVRAYFGGAGETEERNVNP